MLLTLIFASLVGGSAPGFTVVIPCFNCSHTLESAVASLVAAMAHFERRTADSEQR